MAVTAAAYQKFPEGLGYGEFDFSADTLKVLLTTSGYTPAAGHEFVTSITDEVTGTGTYTAGGETLTSVTWTWDSGDSVMKLASANPGWFAASFTARRAVVYKDTGTAGTSRLIGHINFGEDRSPSSQDLVLDFSAGIITLALPVSTT